MVWRGCVGVKMESCFNFDKEEKSVDAHRSGHGKSHDMPHIEQKASAQHTSRNNKQPKNHIASIEISPYPRL